MNDHPLQRQTKATFDHGTDIDSTISGTGSDAFLSCLTQPVEGAPGRAAPARYWKCYFQLG